MVKEIVRNTNNITVANLWENYQLKKYNMSPPYQRKSVWSDEKKSFFIDSIFKNYPIPPIFLKQDIDTKTGKTVYDVVDGKQRISAIIGFITNELPLSSEYTTDDDSIYGLYFDEFDNDTLKIYKKNFWSYLLPIEYIEADDNILDDIFDRLNRNGEPLSGQELRKAKFHDTKLLNLVDELSRNEFWAERLNIVDKNRMEDIEFISELLFMQLTKEPLHSNQKTIDEMYVKYSTDIDSKTEMENFIMITEYLKKLNLDYEKLRITGISHLYGLWCLGWYCVNHKIPASRISDKLSNFYSELQGKKIKDLSEFQKAYKLSMSARTKDKGTRNKRVGALIEYLGIK